MDDLVDRPALNRPISAVECRTAQNIRVRAGPLPASADRRIRYGLGGLTMMWAPAVPGYINHGPLSGVPGTPIESGVAYGV